MSKVVNQVDYISIIIDVKFIETNEINMEVSHG